MVSSKSGPSNTSVAVDPVEAAEPVEAAAVGSTRNLRPPSSTFSLVTAGTTVVPGSRQTGVTTIRHLLRLTSRARVYVDL